MKKTTLSIAERQPIAVRAAVVAVVTAIVHVLVVFGIVSHDQEVAIASLVDALGAVALVLWSIRAVTPNAKVIARVTTTGTVVAGEAAVAPTGQKLPVSTAVTGTPSNPPGVPQITAAVAPELVTRA